LWCYWCIHCDGDNLDQLEKRQKTVKYTYFTLSTPEVPCIPIKYPYFTLIQKRIFGLEEALPDGILTRIVTVHATTKFQHWFPYKSVPQLAILLPSLSLTSCDQNPSHLLLLPHSAILSMVFSLDLLIIIFSSTSIPWCLFDLLSASSWICLQINTTHWYLEEILVYQLLTQLIEIMIF
jgi:hypothetical protein